MGSLSWIAAKLRPGTHNSRQLITQREKQATCGRRSQQFLIRRYHPGAQSLGERDELAVVRRGQIAIADYQFQNSQRIYFVLQFSAQQAFGLVLQEYA